MVSPFANDARDRASNRSVGLLSAAWKSVYSMVPTPFFITMEDWCSESTDLDQEVILSPSQNTVFPRIYWATRVSAAVNYVQPIEEGNRCYKVPPPHAVLFGVEVQALIDCYVHALLVERKTDMPAQWLQLFYRLHAVEESSIVRHYGMIGRTVSAFRHSLSLFWRPMIGLGNHFLDRDSHKMQW